MSMTVVLIRMSPALAKEMRLAPDADAFVVMLDGQSEHLGFDYRTDIWTDADWRDLDAYTGSDQDNPLMQLFQGEEWREDFSYNQGSPTWLSPEELHALFHRLCENEGWDPEETEEGNNDNSPGSGLVAFPGLFTFLQRAVRRGQGLLVGVD